MAELQGFRVANRCFNCAEGRARIDEYRRGLAELGEAAQKARGEQYTSVSQLRPSDINVGTLVLACAYKDNLQCFFDENAIVCDGTLDPHNPQPQPCQSPYQLDIPHDGNA
jgi:hypothetical protein